jgi:hypothetical protein
MKSLTELYPLWRNVGRGERDRKIISCVNKLPIIKSRVAFYSKVTCIAPASAVGGGGGGGITRDYIELADWCSGKALNFFSRGARLNLCRDNYSSDREC